MSASEIKRAIAVFSVSGVFVLATWWISGAPFDRSLNAALLFCYWAVISAIVFVESKAKS